MARVTVQDRVYLDDKGRATTDPEAGQVLWATPGMEVMARDAEAVGYRPSGSEEAPEEEQEEKPKARRSPRTKVVRAPSGDK